MLGTAHADGCPRRRTILTFPSHSQVILRWNTQRNVAVIPKSLTPHRIEANFNLDFDLSEDQMARVDSINRNHRFVRVEWWAFPDDENELEPCGTPVITN
jgi:diketogulonate reductase-like aldo/keto reductase